MWERGGTEAKNSLLLVYLYGSPAEGPAGPGNLLVGWVGGTREWGRGGSWERERGHVSAGGR
jgi:hypothetical protein